MLCQLYLSGLFSNGDLQRIGYQVSLDRSTIDSSLEFLPVREFAVANRYTVATLSSEKDHLKVLVHCLSGASGLKNKQ